MGDHMNWGRLAPWLGFIVSLRTALLTLGGFSSLAAAAFLFNVVAGWAVLGVCLLVLEYLIRPDSETSAGQGMRRR
jgi:hypothetical protein